MPDESLLVEFHSSEHSLACVCTAQLVFAPRHAVESDKEPTALGHPLWNCMRQFFVDGQTHLRSVATHSQRDKQNPRARSPLRSGRSYGKTARTEWRALPEQNEIAGPLCA